jgi:hypothetical protein
MKTLKNPNTFAEAHTYSTITVKLGSDGGDGPLYSMAALSSLLDIREKYTLSDEELCELNKAIKIQIEATLAKVDFFHKSYHDNLDIENKRKAYRIRSEERRLEELEFELEKAKTRSSNN